MTAVDPAFAAVARALYGDGVDPAELAKAVDAADVHIDGPVGRPRKRRRVCLVAKATTDPARKKEAKVAAIGLGATGIAGAAGLHAIKATTVENSVRNAVAAGKGPAGATYAVPKALRGMKPTRAAQVVGGGYLALHGVELVGDALGARAQVKQLKRSGKKLPTTTPGNAARDIEKAVVRVRLKALNGGAVRVVPSLRARNALQKGLIGNVKTVTANAAKASDDAAQITGKVKRLVPAPKTAVLLGAAGATTLGAATGVATYQGAKRGVRAGMTKSFDADVEIAKIDTDKHQVFGWISVSKVNGETVRDRQGDEIDIDELEKTAYKYMLESRVGGDQHARVSKSTDGVPKHTSNVIESVIFTPEKIEKMGLPPDFPQGWWGGFHVHDSQTWELIKSGKRTGFSIHGVGKRVPI